ncbi:WAP four-disulfide core domain protein 18-like isoform X2 [Gigantopelta aegis]|uniref:WAP four-disulfide core domain protein 18-like isoform X2 n=1 Tax=Gigantopelta aegis TaxID=1735272 RepID=UPI001B88A80C|nr:WAP four-disulfide core domain protein 18-like isoform X2 [Gigantopelta aegis]
MKVLLLAACIAVACAAPRERAVFGICVEMCTSNSCPAGQSCRSNGCGHTCQSDSTFAINHLPQCGLVMCALYCPNGFATGKDGCPTCSCNPPLNILSL